MIRVRPLRTVLGLAALLLAATCATVSLADEIRLKDGKKLHGVIVAYEDNMFKVKTDFGYVLVEKDKIASIIPDTPTGSTEAKAATKPAAKPESPAKKNTEEESLTPAVETSKDARTAHGLNYTTARPEIPSTAKKAEAVPPAIKTVSATPKTSLAEAAPPPPPKPEPPPIKEEVQGNEYINHEYAFRMYKAPSWEVIGDAGQALPNAIVAMGTDNESTLLVIGYEKSKSALDPAAEAVEKKLSEVYDNYRLISQRKTTLGGLPGVEYHYRGMADNHDWSGTLAVVVRNGEVFTILGMTYADTDLIQIQENVISRAIDSLRFN
ncbi:MAG TPA: hypothetical protein VL128_01505 [Candidatus Eisenbacteria bacterium]|nr:hypothetical protein [Candidatus Eisenbacteria bacterium]